MVVVGLRDASYNSYRRAPLPDSDDPGNWGNLARALHIPARVIARSSSSTSASDSSSTTCQENSQANTCEKPTRMPSMTITIVVSIILPIVLAICVLFYLHRRSAQRQAREDAATHKSLDFGMGVGDTAGKGKRKSPLGLGGEKRSRGLSMDMNLSSPYLLPAGVQGSRESLNSLAKTLRNEDDPYRPIASYMSETGSVRSVEKGGRGTSSVYTASTKHQSRTSNYNAVPPSPSIHSPMHAPRQNSFPKSPLTPSATSSMTVFEAPEGDMPAPPTAAKSPHPVQPVIPTIETAHPEGVPAVPSVPTVQEPAPVAQKGAPGPKSPAPGANPDNHRPMKDARQELAQGSAPNGGVGLGIMDGSQDANKPEHLNVSNSASPQVTSGLGRASVTPVIEDANDYYDYDSIVPDENSDDEPRGRSRVRESGLPLPQQANRRLSVGVRPLPSDELLDTEDPETRANRIRSFYKEYFDDSKGGDPNGAAGNYGAADYGDAAYFDPDSNQFIMPYAQPVARRAMTPPPSGSRFPGPRGPGPRRGPGPMGPGMRGPPRAHSGSVSGMPMPPRAGSSMSGFGPRPGSSVSGRMRSGSAMSGRPRRPMAPPQPLSTLPTPSKLKDDSFALLNATDFAPPESYSDRVAGRSQSPFGERLPYNPKVPVASPLISAFDDMAALPSPHLLRKSGTFTALDFAPPRKFKDPDTMSETGSIRSNRSGISQVQVAAIRNGAGRVSRLPGDTVFTAAQSMDKLKPQWNMHNN